MPGVRKAEVSLSSKRADVTYDADQASTADLVKAVEGAGFEATVEN